MTFPPPLAIDGFTLHLAWHARHDEDPAVQHVARLSRDAVEAAYASLAGSDTAPA